MKNSFEFYPRYSSINAESARYKELQEDKFYIPKDWKGVKISKGDANEFFYDNNGDINSWYEVLESYTYLGNQLYHECLEDLTPILGRKRAKESARFFKTYNSQIQADVMFNMRSFANFLKLRNSEHAQVEIREIAQEMLSLVQNIEGNPFEQTIKSITKNGKSS
jgi:thymidylate synthase ThyX